MGGVDSIGRGIGVLANSRVHVGSRALRDMVEGIAARTTSHLHVDLFRIDDRRMVATLADVAEDRSLRVLADTDAARGPGAKLLRRAAASWDELGRDPRKQHGKSGSRDGGVEAFVATELASRKSKHRADLGVAFSGRPAERLHDVHAATGRRELRRALKRAARDGVVANDPRVGARHATDAVELLMRGSGPIRIATKAFSSKRIAEQLAQRATTATVEVYTHAMPKAQRKVLERAGATVHVIDERAAEQAGTAIHGTLASTRGHALLGSLFLDDRVLYGSPGRASREVAAVLDAATGANAMDDLLATLAASTS